MAVSHMTPAKNKTRDIVAICKTEVNGGGEGKPLPTRYRITSSTNTIYSDSPSSGSEKVWYSWISHAQRSATIRVVIRSATLPTNLKLKFSDIPGAI